MDGQVDHTQNPPPAPIPQDLHKTRGAISIANKNDSDGDGVVDWMDGNVVGGDRDLMKMVIHAPEPANLPGFVQVSHWTDAPIWIFQSQDKVWGEAPRLYVIATTQWPVTLWIEKHLPSSYVRDHAVRTRYHSGAPKRQGRS